MLNTKSKCVSLAAERLRDLMIYDPTTGIFRWRVDRRNAIRAGTIAGGDDGRGYVVVRIDGGKYLAHRLAFLYMTGKWPGPLVDHKDANPSNNRWNNLREATRQGNSANSKTSARNKCGLKGARWHSRDQRWYAGISVRGQQIHLGTFKNAEDAHAAYLAAARQHFGEFAFGG